MPTPRLEISLDHLHHNARTLVDRLAAKGITVTAVTKALLGDPAVARCLIDAGAARLADSRVENVLRMRGAGVITPITLIRTPLPSQVALVVELCETSCNTELEVIRALAARAQMIGVTHGIVLMVELGDLREGIMADDLEGVVRVVRGLTGVRLVGLGANLACRSGIEPSPSNMAHLSSLAAATEDWADTELEVVSGGNSANINWALSGQPTGRINDLRLGEAILLGCDPLDRRPIVGLRTDAFTLVAEVIESKAKPSAPWGTRGQTAFGDAPEATDRGMANQLIIGIGHQDTDPSDLASMDPGIRIVAASSDHLVVEADVPHRVGSLVRFRPGYRALLRAATSPFVVQRIVGREGAGS